MSGVRKCDAALHVDRIHQRIRAESCRIRDHVVVQNCRRCNDRGGHRRIDVLNFEDESGICRYRRVSQSIPCRVGRRVIGFSRPIDFPRVDIRRENVPMPRRRRHDGPCCRTINHCLDIRSRSVRTNPESSQASGYRNATRVKSADDSIGSASKADIPADCFWASEMHYRAIVCLCS